MKILIVKTSSMGDVIHTMPALTDLKRTQPNAVIDWVVEKPYAALVASHPAIDKVIPIAWRKWRHQLFKKTTFQAIKAFFKQLRSQGYDIIIDAQGLIKSALITKMARGKTRCGYTKDSTREKIAAYFYQKKYGIDTKQHAILRIRKLFAQIFNYNFDPTKLDSGLNAAKKESDSNEEAIILFHGTTGESRHWPESYWKELIQLIHKTNIPIQIGWGNKRELERSKRLQQNLDNVEILPDLDILGVANILAKAKGVIAVDTGFAHLSQAYNIPTLSLHSSTDPTYSGTIGEHQTYLAPQFPCAPCLKRKCHYQGESAVHPACFTEITPELVWKTLQLYLSINTHPRSNQSQENTHQK